MLKITRQSGKKAAMLIALGMAILWVAPLAAETRYVIDQLTLNMYTDTSLSERMDPLKSGDKIEVLQVGDDYSQVKTQGGEIGWVKSSYLDKEPPAALRLAAMQEELDSLRSKHTDLLIEQTDVPAGSTDNELKERLSTAEKARRQAESRLSELEQEKTQQLNEIRELKAETSDNDSQHFLLLWVILPILTLITGFFIGVRFLDKKIRARFGGFSPV